MCVCARVCVCVHAASGVSNGNKHVVRCSRAWPAAVCDNNRLYVTHHTVVTCSRLQWRLVVNGRVHTPFVDGFLRKHYAGREAEMFAKLSEYQPVGRMAKPVEIAHLILYLASDEAAFVTGAAYPIDGGKSCM